MKFSLPCFSRRNVPFLIALTTASLIAGCAGSSITDTATGGVSGPAFVVGTDAPLASVTSFAVQVKAVNATDSTGKSVALISGSPTVDFARFNGLQTLLDMNDVPVGTYTSITIALGPATIGYLNTASNAAPTIQSEAATLTNSTITVPLTNPLIITQSSPVGLRMDFDLRKSIQVDSSGQITGQVNPTFNIKVVGPNDADAYIDEFDAGVVSVNTAAQSFVIQGPHGRQFTVNVNGNTSWDNGESINQLTSSSIVQISGNLDRADATIDADEVGILSQDGFYADGQFTYVKPASGVASSVDLYVRGLLPANTGISLGQIAHINLTGNERYFIYRMHNPLTQFLFNSSALLAGQAVAVGGPASGAASASAVTVNRIALRHWGFNGTIVPGTVNVNNGTFQMQINGFTGLLVPQTVTVYVANNSAFRNGLSGLANVTGSANVRVVGLLLKDPTSGQTILLARYVDALN